MKHCLTCGNEIKPPARKNKKFCTKRCSDKFFVATNPTLAPESLWPEIRRMREQGLGCKRIGKAVGVVSSTICLTLKKMGFTPRDSGWNRGQKILTDDVIAARAQAAAFRLDRRGFLIGDEQTHWGNHPVRVAWSERGRYLRNKHRKLDLVKKSPQQRARRLIRARIYQVLNGTKKSATTLQLIGCTLKQLKTWIEMQFCPGMGWHNQGNGDSQWHLDHILPCAAFDLTEPEQQRQCFNFTNIRPLWDRQNRLKRDKVIAIAIEPKLYLGDAFKDCYVPPVIAPRFAKELMEKQTRKPVNFNVNRGETRQGTVSP